MTFHCRTFGRPSLKPTLLILAATLIVVPLMVGMATSPLKPIWSDQKLPSDGSHDGLTASAAPIQNSTGSAFAFPPAVLLLIHDFLPNLTKVGYVTHTDRNRSEAMRAAAQYGFAIQVADIGQISSANVMENYQELVTAGAQVIVLDDGFLWPIAGINEAAISTGVPAIHRQVAAVGPKLCVQFGTHRPDLVPSTQR